MRTSPMALWLIVVASAAAGGCYEELDPPAQDTAAAREQPAPAPASAAGQRPEDTPRPGRAGATEAAHNTVDAIEERQQELEKAMEDP